MPHPTCSRPTPRLSAADLEVVADHVVGAHARPGDAPMAPALVRARATADGFDLALCPLPAGVHPADALLGDVVPHRWAAAGVVAPATARSLDRLDDPGRPLTVAVLVGRDGAVATRTRVPDGGEALDLDEAPVGRLVDLLQRALQRPTPPPEVSTWCLWEAIWLDAVVADVAGGEGPGSVTPELADALAGSSDPDGPAGWDHLRRLAAAPHGAVGHDVALAAALSPLIDPEVAAWMDDGCFSRWVLGALPPREELLDAVDALLPPPRAEAVRRALGHTATDPASDLGG